MKTNIVRQGDLLIRQINEIPKGAKKLNTQVLAEGETTGHKHEFTKVRVGIYESDGGQKFLEVPAKAPLTHQEHRTVEIDPGKYIVIQEKEFDYFELSLRQVVD